MRAPDLAAERALWGAGVGLIAGIDEVGRGPLAGPVAAGAGGFSPPPPVNGRFFLVLRVRGSKKKLPSARGELGGNKLGDALFSRGALLSGLGIESHRIA